MALNGPAGSGKTYTALAVATALGKTAVIDTERGSASKYADLFEFDVLELDSFEPEKYTAAIKAATDAGYEVVVIDSLSHAWAGKGGILESVDNRAKGDRSGNSFGAWRYETPRQNALIDSVLGAGVHIIATMRSKTEYVQQVGANGKTEIKKMGLAPVQRDGVEYEFDVVGDLDDSNTLRIGKSRCIELAGQVIEKPGAALAATLAAWLGSGEAPRTGEIVAKPDWYDAFVEWRRENAVTPEEVAAQTGLYSVPAIEAWIAGGDTRSINSLQSAILSARRVPA